MKLGKLGLGTFPFSHVFGPVNEEETAKIIYQFFDLGGKYIQTAPYYVGVDPILKKVLAKIPRNQYYLGSLCVKNRQGAKSGKYSAVIEQCEDSLKELGVDHIEVMMTSSAKGSDAPFLETIGALTDLKKQGKIGSIGVCNVNLAQLKEYNSNGDVSLVQNRFSLIDRSLSDEFIEYCVEHEIMLIPYNVIEWGILTNKFLQGLELRDDDFRKNLSKVFSDEPISVLRKWAKQCLEPISKKYNAPIESLAIGWANEQKLVSTSLVGATKKQQIVSSMQALSLEKISDIVHELDIAYSVLVESVQTQYGKKLNEFLRNSYELWG